MIDLEKFEPAEQETQVPVKLKSSFADNSQWETVSQPSTLETTYQTVETANPDEVGEAHRLSRQLGLSADLVSHNLETARNAANRPDLDEIKSQYPTLAGFAKDAWFMALAKDDLENLKGVEQIFTTPMTEWGHVKEQFDVGFKKVARNIANTVRGYSEFLNTPEGFKFLARGSHTFEEPGMSEADIERYIQNFEKDETLQNVAAWAKNQLTKNPNLEYIEPEKRTGIRGYQDDVVQMAPQIIYQLIAAANPAGPVTGTAFMGSQIFGSDYENLTEKGVDPTRAFYAAMADSAMQAPLEQIGIGKAMKFWKPGQTLSAAAKHILESVGTEFFTEWMQQYPQAATEIWAEAEKEGMTPSEQVSKFIEDFGKNTWEGIYQGLVAAPFGGFAAGLNVSANEDFTNIRLKETKNKLDGLKEAIDSTLLKDREPETLQEFINRAAEANGEDGKVYLQADRIVEHANNAGVDVAKWVEGYGVDKQALVNALNTGGNVGLNLGKVASSLSTDSNLAALQDDMALKVDDTPASLAKETSAADRAALVNVKELHEKELSRRLQPIELMSLEDQLVSAGMTSELAKTNAAIYAARANTWASQTGKTAAEWFQRWGLNVSREMVDMSSPTVKAWKPPVPEEMNMDVVPLDAYLPGSAKSEGPQTLRGRIRQAGGINFLNFKGELKVMPTAVKFLSKKTGVPIDSLEQTLKEEGWIDQNESLLDIFRDKEVLKRGKVIGGESMTKTEHQQAMEEDFMAQAERDAEAPPEGTYATVYAEDLPVGEPLTIIDGNGVDGWDVYEVIDKDPFGVTLKDGVTVELSPYDQVQVRVEVEGDKKLYRQAVATPSAMNDYNTQNPDSPVMFNGFQDLSTLNRPDLYYFTITDGKAKGHTFTVEEPTVENIAAGVAGKAENGRTYQQSLKNEASGGIKYIGIIPSFGSKYSEHIYKEYADIIELPEVGEEKGPLADLLTNINWSEATPADIRQLIEKRAESRRPGVVKKIRSVIADQIGEMIETFRYEGHKEGLEFKAYIDSLLEATEEYLPRDRVQDRSTDSEAGKTKASKLSDDPRITLQKRSTSKQLRLFQKEDLTRAFINFGEGSVDITLLKNANLSSFLHETGHLFLEDLRRSAIEDGVMVEEWNRIKSWLQLEEDGLADDWDSLTEEQAEKMRQKHEAFARAFEAYLREGKAPSLELRSAFQQFKAWLRRIYRSILDLNIDLTDEVRMVFDKMLASEKEIKEAEEFAAQLPMFDEMAAKKIGATDEEIREYLEITKRKTEGAIEEADRHKIVGSEGRLKAWREQAEKESFEVQVYRAIYYLTRGVFPGAEGGKSGGGPGIDIESVRENFGQDVVDILPKIPGLLRKEGLSFEHAAAQVGYENGTALLNDLKNMKTREQWIEERIAALDVEYDEQLDTAEAVRNTLARKQLEIESKWLAKQAYKEKGPKLKGAINRRTARIWAEKVIENEIVADAVKVYNSVLTSQRLRKRAIARQRAGDWKGAFELNEKVRLNEELVLARGRAREKLVKIENKMKRFAAADPKKIQNDYRNQLYKLLQRFMFVKKQFAIDVDAESTQKFLEKFQANDEIDALSVPVFAEWIYDSTVSGYYKSVLTWGQLQDVVDFASFLDGRGRELINKYLADQKTSIEDYANDAAEPTRKLKAKRVFSENSFMRKGSDLVRKYLASSDMLMFVLRKMDGFSNIGKKGTAGPNERMWQWLTRARDDRDKIVERIDREARDHIKTLMDGARGTPKQYTHVPVPDIMSRKGMVWTYERIVSIALNMGNPGNINRLVKGYGLSMEDLHDLISVLSEDQLKAVQGLWDVIDTMYPDIDEVYYRINHFHMKKVEGEPLELEEQEERTVDGVKIPARPAMTLSGGYYPLKYDWRLSDITAERAEREEFMSSTGAVYQQPTVKSGATKARTGASIPPLLSLSVLSGHINDMAQYTTHAEIIRDMDRITRNAVWKNEAERFLGDAAYRQVRPALKYAARPEKEWGGSLDTFMDRQRVKATTFILAWNFAVATKQVFSIPGVWTDIGKRNWLKGVGAVIAHPIEWKNTMHEASTYMRNRAKNIDRDIMDSLKKMKGQKRFAGKTWDDIVNTGFCLIKTMDFVAVYPSWVAAYKKAMAEHGSPAKARQYADDTIRASQPSGQPIDLSAFQRDSRGWMKLFTMFSTFTMKYGNRQRYFYRAWREGQMKNHEYAWHVALEAIAPPLLMNLSLGFLQGKDPPEPEELLRDALLYQFVGLPLVRDIVGFAWPSYPGQSAVDSPAFTGLELTGEVGADIVKFTKELLTDDVDEKTIDALIWDLAQLASFISRIPASQIYKKAKKGLNQIDDGEGNVINLVLPDPSRRMDE